MEKKYFENYGEVEYLEPEDFYAGDWSPYDTVTDENGEKWDIVISGDKTEFRYGAF